ncbi:MAG: alpha/beta hydrolase [Anaerolineales bacterium]
MTPNRPVMDAAGMHTRHSMVSVDGIQLHLVEAGAEDGPAVLLLHGFPEYWAGWRHQIPALAAAGFRVLVPDQRGYNKSEKPSAVAAYRLERLAKDATDLLDRLGIERAHMVGHDWGAAVAWWVALSQPERVDRLCILNVPHPAALSRVLRTDRVQWLRSWYIGFFQVPWLPEALLGAADGALLAAAVRRSAPRGLFTQSQMAAMRAAWRRPAALRSMIHWYRALLRYRPEPPSSWTVKVPTRILWGTADAFLVPENAPASLAFCPEGDCIALEGVSHWVQHEAAGEVNQLLIDWFSTSRQV